MRYIRQILLPVLFLLVTAGAVKAQPGANEIDQATEQTMQLLEQLFGNMEGFEEGVGPAFEAFRNGMGIVRDGLEFYNSMQALDENECVPDFTTPAEAMMPTGCASNEECASCYDESINRLNTVRKSLARMRCIYTNTKKFTDAAISFGDNVSGIHGVMGIAWQNERRGIEKSLQDFEKTYDKKYADLMTSMQTALNGINACEAKFGMRDWYQRFGFLYFEMMKEKYKRDD